MVYTAIDRIAYARRVAIKQRDCRTSDKARADKSKMYGFFYHLRIMNIAASNTTGLVNVRPKVRA